MILGFGSADELEPKDVAVGARLRPDDLGMLDRLMVGRCANPERAHLTDGHSHIDCDTEAANARVERQTLTTDRAQEINLGIERPAARTAAGAAVDGDISATLRKDRRESVGNGGHNRAEHIEAVDPWLAFSTNGSGKSIGLAPFGGMHPPQLLDAKPKQRARTRSTSSLRRSTARAT